jgi:hypothetical protein
MHHDFSGNTYRQDYSLAGVVVNPMAPPGKYHSGTPSSTPQFPIAGYLLQ